MRILAGLCKPEHFDALKHRIIVKLSECTRTQYINKTVSINIDQVQISEQIPIDSAVVVIEEFIQSFCRKVDLIDTGLCTAVKTAVRTDQF